jgi:hypothetical protein
LPRLDSGVVKWMPETAARRAIEGVSGRLRGEASVVSTACSVGTPPVWWMRRRHSSTSSSTGDVLVKGVFRHVGVFGQPLHPGGSGFGRGETGLSRRSASKRVLSAGCDQPAGPWPSSFPLLIAHRSVYNLSKALHSAMPGQSARCTSPSWEAQHMAVAPTGGQWVAQP